MQIHIDTSEPLSETDKSVLAVLAGDATVVGAGTAAARVASETKAPAAKKAAATPPKIEAVPDPEPDLIGGGEATVAEAVERATKVIADGGQVAVKAALTEVGAARVSTLEQEQVAGFLAALDAAGV